MPARPSNRASLLAVLLLTAAPFIHAADDKSAKDSKYKTVPVAVGDKKLPVRVMNSDPYGGVPASSTNSHGDGKYHPEDFSFNTTSSYALKKYDVGAAGLVKADPDFVKPGQAAYSTQAYSNPALSGSVPGLSSKSRFSDTSAYARSVTGLDKTYTTASSGSDLNRSAILSTGTTTADFQARSAILRDGREADLLAEYDMAHKQYLGPGAQHVPDGIQIKENVMLSRMSEVPNRPLTVDEVRNLINHGTKPDLAQPHPDASKPLNAPDYKPEPLRDNPSPDATPLPGKPAAGASADDDKNDAIPSPGTMATTPDPLPQR